MVKLSGTFSLFNKINALVIGDFMLDRYTYGKISRISPEAPVSILKVEKEMLKPGGAGNVVLNLLSLGASVKAVGRVGKDDSGKIFLNELKKENACVDFIYFQKDYKTPVKNRFIADNQQVLRVDFENVEDLSNEIEEKILSEIDEILDEVHVVAVSDYAKGFLSKNVLKKLIEKSNEKNIPVIVDPKGTDFQKYAKADIIKPNLSEAYAAAKLSKNQNSLDEVASVILKESNIKNLIITRSEDGISLFSKNMRQDFEVISKEVKDVTGAGDTVLAMISIAIGNKLDLSTSCILSNIAASIAIEHVGCVKVTLQDFAKRLLDYDVDNKIFDSQHLYALKKVLHNKKFSLLGVDSRQGMSTSLFSAIRKLSLNGKKELIIYIKDAAPDDEFLTLLSSLSEISFIIIQAENLKNLCEEIHTQSVYDILQDKLTKLEDAKFLLEPALN
ncbi:MAG: HldE protein [Parachlamydiales bacterium]|nr:HldE protein [Parachlamydiales bacterium]